jgi:hypothetical protein
LEATSSSLCALLDLLLGSITAHQQQQQQQQQVG